MAVMKYPVEIKANLEAAITNLQAAEAALQAGQDAVAVFRAADAAFHTGSMLLLDEEVDPVRHGDVITLLLEIFVHGRRLTKDQGADLSWLFAWKGAEDRAQAGLVTADQAHRAVQMAESFFEASKVILEA
jgi:uncharacterized protein (UPF0332 family)